MYGLGTRSYNRSTEARQNKKAQKEATVKYLKQPRREVVVGPICKCLSFNLPHGLERHKELRSEHDWSRQESRYNPGWCY